MLIAFFQGVPASWLAGYPLIRLQALRSWPVSAAIPNALSELEFLELKNF